MFQKPVITAIAMWVFATLNCTCSGTMDTNGDAEVDADSGTGADATVWVGDFEHGPMPLTRENADSPWYEQANLAEVVTAPHPVRNGLYSVKFFVDRLNSADSRRSMIIPKGEPYEWAVMQDIGKDWWYGFSIYFPASWTTDNIWDLVAQMHGRPDLDIGEDYRNPFLAWFTDGDNISINNIWDAKLNTFESGERVYDGQRELWTGPILREEWTDWVMHAKWSYLDDGLIEIWRNGVQIVNSSGPNCFNDERGGYFDIGIYKGWSDRYEPEGMVGTRLVYFDEVRIAGEDGSYADVAP
jgi:Polysaccharide lyase